MTRIDLLPGVPRAAPVARVRPKHVLRPKKPFTRRELESAFARIKARILKGTEPFGVFVMKHGRGRVVQLLGRSSPEFNVQLRVDRARHHLVAVYDGSADLGDVWEDLTAFDRPAEKASTGQE